MARSVRSVRSARPARVGVLAAGAIALVAACGGPAATRAPAASVPAGALTISAKNYSFTPETLTAPAGSVTFAVTNDSAESHEFEVLQGETSLQKIEAFGPGSTQTLTVTLGAGQYEFACRLNGHDILGMEGTLTVQ